MNRWIVLLGLNSWQTHAVDAAHALGYRVVGVDLNAGAPGSAKVDEFLHCSAHDPVAILEGLDRLGLGAGDIVGVATLGTRNSLTACAAVAASLGVGGPVVDAANAAALVNRQAFKQRLADAGVACGGFQIRALGDTAPLPPLPAVVKALEGTSGSIGVTLVTAADQIEDAVSTALAAAPAGPDSVIVESFVDGIDLGVLGFFLDGRPVFSTVVSRIVSATPFGLPLVYATPGDAVAGADKAREAWARIGRLFQVGTGPFFVEFRVGADGEPVAIEAEPTLPAHVSRLVDWAYGLDVNRMFVAAAAGEGLAVPADIRPRGAACAFVHAPRAGRLRSLMRPATLPPGVLVEAMVAEGGMLLDNSIRRVAAAAYALADDAADAIKMARAVAEQVDVILD